ncbi:unnamed protein product [Cylicocyclus nassatus]|uniref:G protein-coupled receptor n=1 Tax=Cylicocyclus nassatus TaxID=53992 RepID=A0AA36HGH8_CYLNA|nr:unnamed protein product [Cylicocyclus nassatus]
MLSRNHTSHHCGLSNKGSPLQCSTAHSMHDSFIVGLQFSVFLDSAYKLYISSLPADAIRCEYEVYRPQYYFALRGLNVAGGVSFGLSTTFLAVERVLATVSYATYEQNNRRWLGILMASIQVLISFCAGFSIHPPAQFYPYVSPEVGDSKMTKMFGNMFYLLNVIALCAFTVLYFVNRRRRRILCDSQLRVLSTRFQLKENIATTRLMTPIMFVEALMLTSSQLLYYIYLPDLGEDTVVTKTVLEQVSQYAPYAEYQISLMPFLGFLLIVLLPCFHTQIKRSFIRTSHLGQGDVILISKGKDSSRVSLEKDVLGEFPADWLHSSSLRSSKENEETVKICLR